MISRKSIRCTYRKIYSDSKTESTRFLHVYGMIFVSHSHDTTPVVCCRRNSKHIWIFTFIPCNVICQTNQYSIFRRDSWWSIRPIPSSKRNYSELFQHFNYNSPITPFQNNVLIPDCDQLSVSS